MRLGIALASILVASTGAPGDLRAQEDDASSARQPDRLDVDLALEAGTEYDTNIHRLEVPEGESVDIASAPLLRGAARLRGSLRLGGRSRVRFAGLLGGKLFLTDEGQSENVGIASADTRVEHPLSSRRALTFVRGAYYESSAWDPASGGDDELRGRNFETVLGDVGVTVAGPGNHRISIHAGARRFRYKPDADFDWDGDQYGLTYQTTVWRGDPDVDLDAASIDIDVRYELGRRRYAGKAFANSCADDEVADPMCIVPTGFDRSDLHHAVRAEASYTGDRVWLAAYELQLADSNSFGQSLVRQRIELGVTTDTWHDIYATVRTAILVNIFLDPLLLARDVQAQTFLTIDDENRNSLSLHLSRDFGDSWTGDVRYAIYTNEFATDELSFRRQIGYLGLGYKF